MNSVESSETSIANFLSEEKMIYSMLLLFCTLAYTPQREVVEQECTEENPCHGENHSFWSEDEEELYQKRSSSPWPGKREDPFMEEMTHTW